MHTHTHQNIYFAMKAANALFYFTRYQKHLNPYSSKR